MKKSFFSVLVPVVIAGAAAGLTPVLPAAAAEQISQTSLTAIAEEFILQLSQQQFGEAVGVYSEPHNVTTQTLQLTWNDLVAESGPFRRISFSEVLSTGGSNGEAIVRVVCQFGRANRELFVTLAGSNVVSFSPVEKSLAP